jgi:hypothetical protein
MDERRWTAMKVYSFTLDNIEQLQTFLEKVINIEPDCYWLREHLQYKRLGRIAAFSPFTKYDLSGRVFSPSFEWRYQQAGNRYRCLLATESAELASLLDGMEVETCQVALVYDKPKEIFVRGLEHLVQPPSVFMSETARLLVKEYEFQDEIGGKGYILCGVR